MPTINVEGLGLRHISWAMFEPANAEHLIVPGLNGTLYVRPQHVARFLQLTNGGGVPVVNQQPAQGVFAQAIWPPGQYANQVPIDDLADFLQVPTKKQPKVKEVDPENPRKFQELQNYPRLNVNKQACVAYERGRQHKTPEFSWTTYQGYIGIEVEVENMTNPFPIECYWSAKTDGSLRNNGAEFVSQPLAVKQIQFAVEHLYEVLYKNNNPDFSNRTSVHVHVNCRDMTQDQVYNFVLLYSIFEKHFFKVAGTKRWNSIYCVPVYRCNVLQAAKDVIYNFNPNWHKYCALNLLPLIPNNNTGCYGTIEFRHLYGTANPLELMEWINDILCLRRFALEFNTQELLDKIKELNTTSQYIGMYAMIFEKGRKILSSREDFEECISHVKRELFGDDYAKSIKKNTESEYWNFCQNLGLRG